MLTKPKENQAGTLAMTPMTENEIPIFYQGSLNAGARWFSLRNLTSSQIRRRLEV
jgi:hypothetical protein